MGFFNKFTKLMESEPITAGNSPRRAAWLVDESKYFTAGEVKRLRGVAAQRKSTGLKIQRFAYLRQWFMIELGLQSGLRVGEMASLVHGDLLLEDGRSSIIVIGKGNKKRSVWLSSKFRKMCREYTEYKQCFGYESLDNSALLNNYSGKRISKRALQKDFKSILKQAELPKHYSIHCLRHTYTTFLLKASNYNYRFAQQQLGHASIRTTQVYAGVLETEGREAVEKLYQ